MEAMGRPRDAEKTRSEILRVAFGEIYDHGFQATSVNDIVAKMNVTKGAFFHYFPTKSDLGYAITDEILGEMMLRRWIRPLNAYRNPVQGMIRTYRKLMEETTDEELSLGCPLNNLTQEMSTVDPVFREKLRDVLQTWINETEKHLRRAKDEGYLRPNVDVRMAAEFAVMTEEGSAALVKNLGDRKVYWSLYDGFRLFMESISSKPKLGA
jgi:TetR/AcrR family transcriptional regulator, transcriptional repressor for nem operon